nr:hypothetical protein B0A51_17541 [Rachicladosporium sp. CCFEE 5018]
MAQYGAPQSPTSPARRSIREIAPSPPSTSPELYGNRQPYLEHPEVRLSEAPGSPISISPPRRGIQEAESVSISQASDGQGDYRPASRHVDTPDSGRSGSMSSLPIRRKALGNSIRVVDGPAHSRGSSRGSQPAIEGSERDVPLVEDGEVEGLQYAAFDDAPRKRKEQYRASHATTGSTSSAEQRHVQSLQVPGGQPNLARPVSTYTLGSDLRGRTLSPWSNNGSDPGSPGTYARDISSSRRSPGARPVSYIDLLNNVPYHQQVALSTGLNNAGLQTVVGRGASLLDTKKTLDMYRANVKKTTDASVQYEFAIFMMNAANEPDLHADLNAAELRLEAKHILQRLSDRAYPFAQYYLADGFFSGVFNKDKPDHDKAFPLFVAASKHGHAEAGYRAALCYEFGWGTAKSYPKAVQFYRNAAAKNHPGAATRLGMACLKGDMGLSRNHEREGLKFLRRAQESADFQYNTAPYELGMLHLTGYGADVFKDEAYAAQLLTQAAELGHARANLLMGEAYENGLYGCPRDAALSVHFYNGAATRGVPEAMMALCAWYMVGAPPVLEKDEAEACAWAKQAAEAGLPKAEYAIGYFTEMGIGTRRDPLEANMWYVRAAEKGNDVARQRLQIIRAAASGNTQGPVPVPMGKGEAKRRELMNGSGSEAMGGKKKILGIF